MAGYKFVFPLLLFIVFSTINAENASQGDLNKNRFGIGGGFALRTGNMPGNFDINGENGFQNWNSELFLPVLLFNAVRVEVEFSPYYHYYSPESKYETKVYRFGIGCAPILKYGNVHLYPGLRYATTLYSYTTSESVPPGNQWKTSEMSEINEILSAVIGMEYFINSRLGISVEPQINYTFIDPTFGEKAYLFSNEFLIACRFYL